MSLSRGFIARALSLTMVLPAVALSQGGTQGTLRIIGRVVSPNGSPIASADVSIRSTRLAAISDSSGEFAIEGILPGHVTIDARRIGFTPQQFELDLVAGKNRRVQLTLPSAPQTLPDVEVAAVPGKPASYANTHAYDTFFERRAQGAGKFFTREDIERKFKTNTPELLQGLSGVKVRRNGNEWKVQFTRCQMGIPGMSDPSVYIQVFVDGRYIGRADELTSIRPSEIEMMEVYRSPVEVPAQAKGDGCGAIFIWLRHGH